MGVPSPHGKARKRETKEAGSSGSGDEGLGHVCGSGFSGILSLCGGWGPHLRYAKVGRGRLPRSSLLFSFLLETCWLGLCA